MTTAHYCDECGARFGDCACSVSREPAISAALGRSSVVPAERDELSALGAHAVIVAGQWARMVREPDGSFLVVFEGDLPPFRACGLPSEVLALAEEHVRRSAG